jgi:RNA recognition motif-containing protein
MDALCLHPIDTLLIQVEFHKMDDGQETEADRDIRPASRLSFYLWLRSIRGAMVEGKEERLAELRKALAEKHASVGLTRNEVMLRNALEVYYMGTESSAADSNIQTIQQVLEIHRAHTFNSSSSSQDHVSYVAYATLLLHLHASYYDFTVGPLNDDTEDDEVTDDPMLEWTGIKGGPIIDQRGCYLELGNVKVARRTEKVSAEGLNGWDAVLSYTAVSSALKDLCGRLEGDMRNSQTLWLVRRRFELMHASTSARATELEAVYTQRLRQPHIQIEETAQAFSSYITASRPAGEYESIMAQTYQTIAEVKRTVAACEAFEDATKASESVATQTIAGRWQPWKQYTKWAASSYLNAKGNHIPSKLHLESKLVSSIFERALLQCGMVPSIADESSAFGNPPLTKKELSSRRGTESRQERAAREDQEKASLLADQNASSELWIAYMRFLGASDLPGISILNVCERARKAQPHHGAVQGAALRVMRRKEIDSVSIDSHFTSALANEELRQDPDQIAELLTARIDIARYDAAHKRLATAKGMSLQDALTLSVKDEEMFMDVYGFMTFALDNLSTCQSPSLTLQLEQVCSDWCVAGGEAYATLADPIWKTAITRQPQNGLAWIRAATYYLTIGDLKEAAQTVRRGLGRNDIPSSRRVELAELLLRISRLGGSLAEIESASKRISNEQERVWNDYYASMSTQSAANQFAVSTVTTAHNDIVMVDDEAVIGGKRKNFDDEDHVDRASTSASATDKKNRQGDSQPARDREFASIIIDRLPVECTEADVISLFGDCGEILNVTGPKALSEINATDGERLSHATALLEFVSKEAVSAARSKHLKAVKGKRIEVQLGYECTLYVTNFPAAYDSDQAIKALFSSSGRIFDVRWPSKKFASTRRFCYVVFCNAAEAQQALILHETELDDEGGRKKLQVLLSNPHRKKIRSDAFADEKELFVSGLSRAVTEDALRELFGPGVEHVRIPKHPDGRNRGIAYIDMTTVLDAQRVIGRSAEMDGGGYRINGKLITVNPVEKKKKQQAGGPRSNGGRSDDHLDVERRNRCLYLRGLPSDAQEPIIQQVIERYFGKETVKRIEWTAGQDNHGQALVEFADAKHAGLASLSTEEMLYADTYPLRFATLESRGAASSLIPRQAGQARRAGRGRGGPAFARASSHTHGPEMDVDASPPAQNNTSSTKGQDAFRQMLYKS